MVRWSDLLFCHVLDVMPMSGPMWQLQQKPLVNFWGADFFPFIPFLGWVWFTLCYCCCLGCSLLPFCVNDFKVLCILQIYLLQLFYPENSPLLPIVWNSTQDRDKQIHQETKVSHCDTSDLSSTFWTVVDLYFDEILWSGLVFLASISYI